MSTTEVFGFTQSIRKKLEFGFHPDKASMAWASFSLVSLTMASCWSMLDWLTTADMING